MDRQEILDSILSRLRLEGCQVEAVSLVCRPEALEARLRRDVAAGLRTADAVPRGLARLPLYDKLDTRKIDTTGLSPEEAAARIGDLCPDHSERMGKAR